MSNLTSTSNLTCSGNLVVGGNCILGSSSLNTVSVNSNTTFFQNLGTNGITNTGSISTTGDISCADLTCDDITSTGVITAGSFSAPTFTGTTTINNLNISGSLSVSAGINLPGTFYTPSSGQLGYIATATDVNNVNRLITSNTVFNVNSITLAAGSYIIYYKATLGLESSGTSDIRTISHGLSSTSSTQVAPSQIYHGGFSLNYSESQQYTITSSEIRSFTSQSTYRLNFLCTYTGNNLYCLSADSLVAIRIA